MKQRIVKLSVVAASVAFFAAAAWSADTMTAAKFSRNDAEFVKEAAQGSLMEVELGKIAQTKGASESVKDFGKRMEQDHSKANDEQKISPPIRDYSLATSSIKSTNQKSTS